ncbi:dTMP kinase [Moraxella nasovis]|uniref:dTMP kinase n=1 Tax=Moraxella nasovis TaxID=2904121 RepID=UPI001F61C62F|nr:dTMP kinase [Moraxella nasovis]UNU74190.1 dTMP kinase [Moraxella nasovis]
MSALFISFEGTEGVGKTTAIDHLCQTLADKGVDFIRTREPGGSIVAEKLRAILLDKDTQINDDTELLLMHSARADHLHQTILPALAADKWVICDRFVDSTVAYQGFGRFFGDKAALQKIKLLTDGFVPRLPDLTFWLDLDVHLGMSRASKRSVADRFETEKLAFFERVYEGLQYQAMHYDRICRIDASGSPEDVLAKIILKLEPFLPNGNQ